MIPRAYRELLADRALRGLLGGMGVSAVGNGLSTVTVAWLAVQLAPSGHLGLFVGVALAAYSLPAAAGAIGLARLVRRWPVRWMVVSDCALRVGMLGAIAVLSLAARLSPAVYVILLGGSSVMAAWGNSGQYTLLSALGGPERRLTANAFASAQISMALIVGPAVAGVLLGDLAPGWLIAVDACSFAYLGFQALRIRSEDTPVDQPTSPERRGSGFAALRHHGLYGVIAVTWLFFFLYGPVDDAIPVYVARVNGHAGLLGAYWAAFGVGALSATLVTGLTRIRHDRLAIVVVIAGWGVCLLPFAFAPIIATLICFAAGGVMYGPFIPLTYTLVQSLAAPADLPSVLAARSAITTLAQPLGTAVGGPLIAWLGAAGTITASGAATIALACFATILWHKPPRPAASQPELS